MSIAKKKSIQNSDILDENVDECITDESSPNSMQNYTFSISNKENVLIHNKGNVKNKEKFKDELLKLLKEKHKTLREKAVPLKQRQRLNISQAKKFQQLSKENL